ncbi:MAG: cell division protein FtsL [Desulfamplus sp.]|nr:cell division protein FtsL [Desulfamplus sp.]
MTKAPERKDSTMRDEDIRLKKKLMGKWMIIIAIFLAELFLYTLCRVNYTETGFRISREKKTQKNLKEYQDSLIIEHERLLSPERISGIARTRLNLTIPTPDQVIYMDM